MRTIIAIAVFAALAAACKKKDKQPPGPGSGNRSGSAAAAGSAATAGSDAGSAASASTGSGSAATPPALPPGATRIAGDFMTPESVLYDQANDVYLVSNINGKPADPDDNGFISKVKPDGTIEALKWIDGGKDDVKLDAPKGMAIAGGTLYVADITVVRTFELKTGKQTGEIKLDGATFVNDLVAAPDGKTLYASDTGVDASFQPTKTDAVWKIVGTKPIALAKDPTLGNPNGVITSANGQSVWTVTFGSGELREITGKGEVKPGTKLPKGKLDGIVWAGDTLLVSSWEGSAIFQGKPGGEWKAVATGLEAPADIGFDGKRKRVLVPRFTANDVVVIAIE